MVSYIDGGCIVYLGVLDMCYVIGYVLNWFVCVDLLVVWLDFVVFGSLIFIVFDEICWFVLCFVCEVI